MTEKLNVATGDADPPDDDRQAAAAALVDTTPPELDAGVNLRSKHDLIMSPQIKAADG